MSDYLIQDSTLSGIADKIRVLNGTEETLTPTEMIDKLNTANASVAESYSLIADIGIGGSGDTLTWDGNTDGLVSVADMLYKVSDATPTAQDVANGCLLAYDDGIPKTIMFVEQNGAIVEEFRRVAIIPNNVAGADIMGFVFPEKGVYFMNDGSFASASLTIPGYTGFGGALGTTINELPDALMPIKEEFDGLGTVLTAQDDLIVQIIGALEGKTVPSGGGSVETITGRLAVSDPVLDGYTACYLGADGNPKTCNVTDVTSTEITVIKGSLICVNYSSQTGHSTYEGATLVYSKAGVMSVFVVNEDGFRVRV